MSDADDLNITNSISVDENASETFENSAVGEESEYITLSDILSDEVKQPTEMPGEFDDFLYENDEASQEFQTHLNDVVNNQLADAVSQSQTYNNTAVDSHEPAAEVTKPAQKRARKSRKIPKDVTTEYNQLESPGLCNTRRSKRERKPRVIPDTVLHPEFQQHPEYSEHLTKEQKKTNQGSKRGRKSKVISNPVITPDFPQKNSEDVKIPQEYANLANGGVHDSNNKKKRGRKPKQLSAATQQSNFGNDLETDQEGDDICLSKIKAQLSSSSQENQSELIKNKPILSDFEYDIENVITQTSNVVVESVDTAYKPLLIEDNIDNKALDNNTVPKSEKTTKSTEICSNDNSGLLNSDSLLVEDTSKRPVRKKARHYTKYQIDSDEDPFANEDRPKRSKKRTKYYSDDEYIPDGEAKQVSSEEDNDMDEFDSDFDENILSFSKKRKWPRKRPDGSVQNKTPKKIPKILPEVTTLPPAEASDDLEQMLESSVIKSDPLLIKTINAATPNQEFENFLATRIPGNDLLVKKVSSFDKPALEIPSINPKELPKLVDRASQTKTKETSIACVQTSSPYAIKMVSNINFTLNQSEKACDFLKNILCTTSELGKLMTEKSEEFMQKKINTTHVKDTTKMDYCVKKAFLLFKLAKDNLSTMEETLEKQYEEFLRTNDFGSAIVTDTKITPKPAVKDDSDCEIIDDPLPAKPTNSKANSAAKTVFLNKELSIKIAKKAPTTTAAAHSSNIPNKTGKTLDVQGKTAVWLNSAIMVKKVKPTNHFLAQDGRNKKPPDTITNKMVKDFFDCHSRRKASEIYAQFTSPEWLHIQPPEVTCNYFVVTTLDNESSPSTFLQPLEPFVREPQQTNSGILTPNGIDNNIYVGAGKIPQSLVSLCTKACNKMFKLKSNGLNLHLKDVTSLSNLCLIKITSNLKENNASIPIENLEESFEDPTTDDEQLSLVESSSKEFVEIASLKKLCFNKVAHYFSAPRQKFLSIVTIPGKYNWDFPGAVSDRISRFSMDSQRSPSCLSLDQEIETYKYNVKPLQSIVYQYLLHVIYGKSLLAVEKNLLLEDRGVNMFGVKTLFRICFQLVRRYINPEPLEIPFNNLTIDTINTMSDQAFHDLGSNDNYDQYTTDDHYFNEEDYNNAEETQNEQAEENWMTKEKLKELRLGIISDIYENSDARDALELQSAVPLITRIKTEIPDEIPEDPIQLINLKTEPEEHNEMVSIPDDIVTKAEHQDYIESGQNNAALLTNVDAEGFESFIRGNKMIQGMSSYLESSDADNIFSQSAYRVRRQHAPDSDTENDYDMDLLVPHDSEVFDMVKTKGNLMNSSSSDDEKNKSDKKGDKKKKSKAKKQSEAKQSKAIEVARKNISKEKGKPQPEPENEVAILTRRMRDKIRTEEKKDESDSDIELNLNKFKNNKEKAFSNSQQLNSENEIQCNSVDSTAVITDNKSKIASRKSARKKDADVEDNFTGFNNEDLTEIEKYKKQLDDVYDKILCEDMRPGEPAVFEEASNASDRFSPPLMADEPAEILECEPTMPIFEPKKPRKSKSKPIEKVETSSATESAVETGTEDNISIDKIKLTPTKEKNKQSPIVERPFVEKDGWKCYQMDIKDTKLNQVAYIGLEKLPEAFVQTYFRYQEINSISKEDVEVNRLANLQSLHRSGKEPKPKGKGKGSSNLSGATTTDISPIGSDADNFEELVPSDDEANFHDNEDLPALPLKQTENTMAKTILMDEQESASDGEGGRIKIKKELPDPDKLPLSEPKSAKNVKVVDHPNNLVLTADKMMKKELDMLHAPVNLDEDLKYSPTDSKPRKHSSKSHSKRERRKSRGDDSSSEEEKLWVNTKSKLLKRMEKRVQENTTVDDAKRAKIVSEFIERRTDSGLVRVGPRKRLSRVSRKTMLEREKQMRVLSKEFTDGQVVGKGSSVSYSKGRKNIRKVLDKKSLARSTVTANMEEFARKRRLHMKQNRLRELLGFEENVNVLVINDEVCLEYDFKDLQPVVTIHPFFTRVMKAHQYEGVKFMWDACFESLEVIASGHPGAGCILAHCMGLGKTLQVLALLHTVLTHPKVGMHRVLVCCPLSTVLNWVDEINKWLGPVTKKIKVFELSKLKRTYERAYQLEDWYTGGGIFIVGYELFRSLTTLDPEYDDIRPTIVKKIRMALLDPGPDIVVCDEGHLLKNDSSVLALAMSRVKTKRRIVLTGTPMQNNLREYFCMVNFIKPNLLGTYSEYSNRFENPIMNGQHRDSREEDIRLMKARTHILHKVLEGCLQRQEASVLYPYLPTKHEYTVFIKLSDSQTDLYKHYLHNYAKSNRLNIKNNILKDFHVLQKIWSHPHVLHSFLSRVRDDKVKQVKEERIEDDLAREELAATEDVKPIDAETGWWLEYLDNGKLLDELEASTKFQVVFNILKECVALDDKLLIFSTSLYTMDSLEYFLKKINNWSLGQEYYRLDGTVPPEVRHKWCREFNAENNHKTKLFLISTRAGSLGLNMTAANRVIILDTSWNPAHDIQSIFRIYRFGQKKDCFIYRLVAMGTMEQKIYERSVTKQAVACRVVDEQQIDRHYNMADLAELYDQSGWGISCGVAGAVRDVVLLRAARLPCLYAAHEHDSLLRAARDQDLPEHERAAAWDQFQLEHEHTKVQTGMALALSVFGPQQAMIPNDFGISIPPLPNTVPLKTEPTPPDNLIAPLPTPTPKGKEKGKKGKKNKIETAEPPKMSMEATPIQTVPKDYQPGITIVPPKGMKDPDNFLDRIRDLLKATDFRNADGVIDATAITKVISSLVSSEQITVSPPKTNVEENIKVVEPKKQDDPPQTDQPIADIHKSNDKSKRGRPKKTSVVGNLQPGLNEKKPSEISVNPNISRDGRYRRRAAVVAERNLESVSKDYLTVSSDEEYQPDDNDVSQDYQPDDNDASQDSDFVIPAKEKPSKMANQNSQEESIILSDDDDLGAANRTPNECAVIPMHRSLLKNKNFIKIVAHTYLKGNPMLDEDAAMLAAEYSTNKALKEVEITGKDIDSGPIYDIASQVLGLDVLKKLMVKDSNKTATAEKGMKSYQKLPIKQEKSDPPPKITMPSVTPRIRIKTEKEMRLPAPKALQNQPSRRKAQLQIFEKDDMGADMDERVLIPMQSQPASKEPELTVYKPGPSSAKAARTRTSMAAFQENVKVQSGPSQFVSTPVPSSSSGVVPIGIFKRTESLGLTMPIVDDECILPDDDDVRIGVEPPVRRPPIDLTNIKPVIIRGNKANLEISPIMRCKQASEQNPTSDFAPTITDGLKTIQLKRLTSLPDILMAKKHKLAVTAKQHTLAAATSATINLDSDEEDSTPLTAPNISTQPIPAPNTKVNSNQCIVIPASAFQEILKRVQSVSAAPNIQSTEQSNPAVTTSMFISQIKAGERLFMPSSRAVKPLAPNATPAAKATPTTITPAKTTPAPKPQPAKPKPAARANTPPKPASPKQYPDIAISSSSESERSRSPSPIDPMAILRNVVHIQADPAPTQPNPAYNAKPERKPAPPPKPSPVVPSHSKATRSQTNKPPPKPTQKSDTSKLKMSENVKIKQTPHDGFKMAQLKTTGQPSKSTVQPSKSTTQPSKTSQQSKTAKNTKDDTNYRLLGSFDLTDLPELFVQKISADKPGTSTTSAKLRKTQKPPKTTTITGKARDVILTSGNKSGVKAITNDSSVMEKSIAAKRKPEPAPVIQNSAPKRKKPTRLEEFSLDDLEDIIELE